MSRRRSLLSLGAVFALAGCFPDEMPVQASAHKADARAEFQAVALSNYTGSQASGTIAAGLVSLSPNGRHGSTLCPVYDGSRDALFIAWPTTNFGADPDRVAAKAATVMGSAAVTQISKGTAKVGGRDVKALPGCNIPPLEDGTPVAVVRVSVPAPAVMVEAMKQEIGATNCPEGEAGAIIQKRTVTYSTEAPPVYGEWQTVDISACAPTLHIGTKRTDTELAPWDKGAAAGELGALLVANSPDKCLEAKVAAQQKKEDPTAYTVSTCISTAVEKLPECPSAAIELPPLSSKAAYSQAVQPYEEYLSKLPAYCTVTLKSDAWWPLWTTFNIEAAGARLTRLYHARIPMTWTGAGGQNAFDFQAYSWRSLYEMPDWLSTDSQHWLMLKWSGPTASTGYVYTMNGRGYYDYIGPNTAQSRGKLVPPVYSPGNYPIPYPNADGNPWGNTPEQLSKQHSISYNAFRGRNYIYEGPF